MCKILTKIGFESYFKTRNEVVRTETLHVNNNELIANGLVPLNPEEKEFNMLMSLYKKAQIDILDKLRCITRIF